MPYKANMIRASNDGPSNPGRRNVQPPQRSPPPQPVPFLPQLPPGYIYYGVQLNMQVQASINDGAITGHARRLSPEIISTLNEVKGKAKLGRRLHRVTSIYFDKDSQGFSWLLDSWLAEKRILPSQSHYWV